MTSHTDAAPVLTRIAVSDPGTTGALYRRMRDAPRAVVTVEPERPGDPDPGAAVAVRLLTPSYAALAGAVRTVPDFLRALPAPVSVTVTVTRHGRSVTVTVDDPDAIEAVLDRFLRDVG